MTNSPAPHLPKEISEEFFSAKEDFAGLDGLSPSARLLGGPVAPKQWQPQRLQYWYDGIIDCMLANPGIRLSGVAKLLGRSPNIIGLIVRSDLFKLRYEERRKSLAEEIDSRITSKLGAVAEKALDTMLEVMETKRDKIPLDTLKEIGLGALDKLGYGQEGKNAPSVVINNHNAQVSLPSAVSPEALARARDYMKTIEHMNAGGSPLRVAGPEVEVLPATGGDE